MDEGWSWGLLELLSIQTTVRQFCATEACMLALTAQEYEALRAHANRFVVAPGHVVAQVEVVVESKERFVTVMMIGAGVTVARHFDPRHRQSHLRALTELSTQNLV